MIKSLEKTPWGAAHREGQDGMWNTEVFDSDGETICVLSWYTVETEIEDGTKILTSNLRDEHAAIFKAAPNLLGVLGECIEYLDGNEKNSICSTSVLHDKMKKAFQMATDFQSTRLMDKNGRFLKMTDNS